MTPEKTPDNPEPIDLKALKEQLENLPEDVRENLGQGAVLRLSALKTLHKSTKKAGMPTEEMERHLELLEGTKDRSSLVSLLGIKEDADPKKATADPAQTDAFPDEAPDYRTWEKTADEVRELVSEIISESVPARAVQILNNLEDGEKKREPKPRKNVLDIIRAARSPLADKVKDLSLSSGAEVSH